MTHPLKLISEYLQEHQAWNLLVTMGKYRIKAFGSIVVIDDKMIVKVIPDPLTGGSRPKTAAFNLHDPNSLPQILSKVLQNSWRHSDDISKEDR